MLKCSFSIDADAFNKTEESEFVKAQKKLFDPGFLAGLKFLISPLLPKYIFELIPVSLVLALFTIFEKLFSNVEKKLNKY